VTCPHCGLDVANGKPTTADGGAHAYCANVAQAQSLRPWLTTCYKHPVELDAGWCPRCREIVDAN
jgi:hypothetical protein